MLQCHVALPNGPKKSLVSWLEAPAYNPGPRINSKACKQLVGGASSKHSKIVFWTRDKSQRSDICPTISHTYDEQQEPAAGFCWAFPGVSLTSGLAFLAACKERTASYYHVKFHPAYTLSNVWNVYRKTRRGKGTTANENRTQSAK